jgi:hypothetical protein
MLPEEGPNEVFRDAVIAHLPLWELCDRLLHDGITVHHFNYRPTGLVLLEVSWHMAHETWGHAMPVNAIRDLLIASVQIQGYVFMRWEVAIPTKPLWLDTANDKGRQARVYLKPGTELRFDVQHVRAGLISKVNENILATSFKLSEEAGLYDRD